MLKVKSTEIREGAEYYSETVAVSGMRLTSMSEAATAENKQTNKQKSKDCRITFLCVCPLVHLAGEDDSLALKKKVTIEDVFGPDLRIHDPDAKWLSGKYIWNLTRCCVNNLSNFLGLST